MTRAKLRNTSIRAYEWDLTWVDQDGYPLTEIRGVTPGGKPVMRAPKTGRPTGLYRQDVGVFSEAYLKNSFAPKLDEYTRASSPPLQYPFIVTQASIGTKTPFEIAVAIVWSKSMFTILPWEEFYTKWPNPAWQCQPEQQVTKPEGHKNVAAAGTHGKASPGGRRSRAIKA